MLTRLEGGGGPPRPHLVAGTDKPGWLDQDGLTCNGAVNLAPLAAV
jgi:hypothetical protein